MPLVLAAMPAPQDEAGEEARAQAESFARATKSSRSLSRSTLPRSLLGRSATMRTCFGSLAGGRNFAQCASTSAAVSEGVGHHVAHDFLAVDLVRHAHRRGIKDAGMAQTARQSISSGAMLTPPRMMMSFVRPVTRMKPPASRMPRSPVLIRLPRTGSIEPSSSGSADRHLRTADRDLAFDIDRARPAGGIDDLQFLVQRRQTDGAHLRCNSGCRTPSRSPTCRRAAGAWRRTSPRTAPIASQSIAPVLQLINRNVGVGLASTGVFSSMLSTVGTPAAKVMPLSRIQSKKRLCRSAWRCQSSALLQEGRQAQHLRRVPAERAISSVRSSTVRPKNSSVSRPLSQYAAWS